nr:crs8 [Clonostachys rosea]
MALRTAFFALAFAALCAFVYERANVVKTFYVNHPDRMARINATGSYEIKFQDRIRNCEDACLLEDKGLAILACDAGRDNWNTVMGVFHSPSIAQGELYVYNYATSGLLDADRLKKIELVGFPANLDFHTVGFGFDKESSTLFVTNHARTGSQIEQFKLDIERLVATHVRSIKHPDLIGPNAILPLNAEELLVSNDHYFLVRYFKPLAKIETYLGLPTGPVVYVNLQNGQVKTKVVARVPFPNGIHLINDTTLAVASSSRATILFYTVHDYQNLEYRSKIDLSYFPDNLAVAGDKLLIAGHAHLPTVAKFTESRHICNFPEKLAEAPSEVQEYCRSASATSWVSEWSEAEGVKHIYAGTEYPTSSTFLRDSQRNVGIIVGLYAKGIMVFKE